MEPTRIAGTDTVAPNDCGEYVEHRFEHSNIGECYRAKTPPVLSGEGEPGAFSASVSGDVYKRFRPGTGMIGWVSGRRYDVKCANSRDPLLVMWSGLTE